MKSSTFEPPTGGSKECPTGCGRPARRHQIMCWSCWHQVPKELQDEVYRTWRVYMFKRSSHAAAKAFSEARDAAIASIQ